MPKVYEDGDIALPPGLPQLISKAGTGDRRSLAQLFGIASLCLREEKPLPPALAKFIGWRLNAVALVLAPNAKKSQKNAEVRDAAQGQSNNNAIPAQAIKKALLGTMRRGAPHKEPVQREIEDIFDLDRLRGLSYENRIDRAAEARKKDAQGNERDERDEADQEASRRESAKRLLTPSRRKGSN